MYKDKRQPNKCSITLYVTQSLCVVAMFGMILKRLSLGGAVQQPPVVSAKCHEFHRRDAWAKTTLSTHDGVVEWRACCALCREHASGVCNTWTFNVKANVCTLKQAEYYPERPILYANDDYISGSVYHMPTFQFQPNVLTRSVCVHTIMTSGFGNYQRWQSYSAYKSWKRVVDADGRFSIMKGFTRLMHGSPTGDTWYGDAPTKPPNTVVVAPEPGVDHHGFPVGDRAHALWNVSETLDSITPCSHVAVVETDTIFMKPFTRDMLPAPGTASVLHFGYVDLNWPDKRDIVRKFVSNGPLESLPQTGISPSIMHRDDFVRVMRRWHETHRLSEADDEWRNAFGWIRDMASFTIALHNEGVRAFHPLVPYAPLAVQTPADSVLGEATLVHYTWGPIISTDGKELWRWDKRSYLGNNGAWPLPLVPLPPPWKEGMRLQANETVTVELIDLLTRVVTIFNDCIST